MSGILVAIETGGTKIVCRATDLRGKTLVERRLATGTPAEALRALQSIIEQVARAHGPVAGIGIASFGPVMLDRSSPDFGRVLATPKGAWAGFDLPRALRERFDAPVAIDTDANAAAIAEQSLGAGRGCSSVAYVTVGTGIGGGLATDGHSLLGALHPEIGHLPVLRVPGDSHASSCPFHDHCVEGLAAGPAIASRLGAVRSLADAPDVRRLVADYLGQLMANLLLAWSPHRIVLGGGVMATVGLIDDVERSMLAALGGYGAAVVAGPRYLALAELRDAGLEGGLMMARAISQHGDR